MMGTASAEDEQNMSLHNAIATADPVAGEGPFSNETSVQAASDWHYNPQREQHWGTCVHSGIHCGSPGARSRHCCGGLRCVESPGESGVKRCLGFFNELVAAGSSEVVVEVTANISAASELKQNTSSEQNDTSEEVVLAKAEAQVSASSQSFCRKEGDGCGVAVFLARPCCGGLQCETAEGDAGKGLCLKPSQCISAGQD